MNEEDLGYNKFYLNSPSYGFENLEIEMLLYSGIVWRYEVIGLFIANYLHMKVCGDSNKDLKCKLRVPQSMKKEAFVAKVHEAQDIALSF